MVENQRTLKKSYNFEGKGLHTGKHVKMSFHPAPINTGVVFLRTDISDDAYIKASIEYVTHTQRGTTLEKGNIKISTLEHVLSTFVGLGIDNVLVKVDQSEVPIVDGSAQPFVEAIMKDGLLDQDAERLYYKIEKEINVKDEESGAELVISPADSFSIDLIADYNSKILGIQKVHYDDATDFVTEIAPCRTFVFFNELEFLFQNNLIKGGDLENAIVIVEKPVPQDYLDKLAKLFNVDRVERVSEGYLDNIKLRFPDECGRHKLLDVLGDFGLLGHRIKGKILANKTGHRLNTTAAKIILEQAVLTK